MKAVAICSTSILAIFLGTSLLANAQPDHRGRDDDRQDRHRGNAHQQEHSRPSPSQHDRHEAREIEQRHDQGRGPREAVQRGPERPMQYRQPAPGHFREASRREPERFEHRDIWQRQRAEHWQREHRPWHERGGYHGYRIPEELRSSAKNGAPTWSERAKSIEYVGSSGTNSCTPSGPGGWTGCWSQLLRQAREERKAAKENRTAAP